MISSTPLLASTDANTATLRKRRRAAVSRIEARIVLVAFLSTFVASRLIVHLMMAHRLPEMYLHVGPEQTHVHHLNYGIFLLSFIGAYLIFVRPRGRHLSCAAAVYGIAMGLTFDEFGMWYHLSGNYWQQASYDAVIVIGALFTLLALAPEVRRLGGRGWLTASLALMTVTVFAVGWRSHYGHAVRRWGTELHHFAAVAPAQ